ncbi:homeobox protein ceh-24-like [Palaemon carinicauda]|uniref:homeobox protein ceh-24-like n=1 Tax=Palaemon carinicauda TaxID=392227 RepID=UPI0035B67827
MVTRYTIDQILACNDPAENARPVSPACPSEIDKTAPVQESGTVLPVLKSKVILRGDVEIREVTRGQSNEQNDGVNDLKVERSNTEEQHEEEEGASIINLSMREKVIREDTSGPICSLTNHGILRPVPLRPKEAPDNEYRMLKEQESTLVANSDTFERRPEGSFTGLDGNNFYGLIWRQYLEAQFRGLGTSAPLAPLPYHVLDTALPHVSNSVGLPYHVVSSRSRRRGGQVRFTGDQTRRLEAWFHLHKYITPPQRKTIARELNLQERQVKTWFQNRRAKWRKTEGQNGAEGLPSDRGPSPQSTHEGSGDDQDEDALEKELESREELVVDEDQLELEGVPSCSRRTCLTPADLSELPKKLRYQH